MPASLDRRPLIAAGVMLGMGLGGSLDGILFRQVLQLHNMISAVPPPATLVELEVGLLWDGLFHASTWAFTAIGVALLFRAGARAGVPWSGRTLLGSMVMGWGLFNLAEGAIDHKSEGFLRVVEGPGHVKWALEFLASGALFLALGLALIRAGRADRRARGEAATP